MIETVESTTEILIKDFALSCQRLSHHPSLELIPSSVCHCSLQLGLGATCTEDLVVWSMISQSLIYVSIDQASLVDNEHSS